MPEANSPVLEETDIVVQVVSFQIANETYALDILNVQEINRTTRVTKVPLTKDWIEGVINLRGQIVPLINLRKRVGLPSRAYDKKTRFIIIKNKGLSIGIVVDSVAEVSRISRASLVPVPTTTIEADFIKQVSKREEGLVIILDIDKIFYEEKDQIQEELS